MTTEAFQRLLDDGRTQNPLILVRIDGFGYLDGSTPTQYVICNRIPAYATSTEKYLPILTSYPNLLETEINPLGGIETPNQVVLNLLDLRTGEYPYGIITELFADEQRPWRNTINQSVNTSQTNIPINSIASVSASLTWMNGECLRITGTTGSNLITTERGVLGTTAQYHPVGSSLYSSNPLLLSRRVSVKLGFDELTEADEEALDSDYYIRSFDLKEHLNVYEIKASSRQDWFNREVASGQITGKQVAKEDEISAGMMRIQGPGGANVNNNVRGFYRLNRFYALVGDELMGVGLEAGNYYKLLDRNSIQERGVLGSNLLKPGDWENASFRLAAVANKDLEHCPFLYQEPGTEVSTINSDQWVKTDHPVLVLLCLLCSAQNENDGLLWTNWTTDQGNFSSLPPGWGIGIPANYIDFDSFWRLYNRYPSLRVNNLVISQPERFLELAERDLLRPFGFILGWEGNQITLRKQRAFSAVFSTEDSTFSENEILMIPGRDAWKPDVQLGKSAETLASEVQFINKTPMGTVNKLTLRDADFPNLFQTSVAPEFNRRFLRIETTALEYGSLGDEYFMETRAAELLYWFSRPVWRVSFRSNLSRLQTRVGDWALLSHRDLPKMGRGRDWSEVPVMLTSKRVSIGEDETSIQWEGVIFDRGENFGGLSPSARITAISGSNFTVAVNVYTSPDGVGVDPDLPTTDVDAFKVGWVLRCKHRDFGPTSGDQTITAIAGNVITLDGDFSGLAAVGDVLEFTVYDSQVATGTPEQRGNFIAMAQSNPPRLSVLYPDDPIFQYGGH